MMPCCVVHVLEASLGYQAARFLVSDSAVIRLSTTEQMKTEGAQGAELLFWCSFLVCMYACTCVYVHIRVCVAQPRPEATDHSRLQGLHSQYQPPPLLALSPWLLDTWGSLPPGTVALPSLTASHHQSA